MNGEQNLKKRGGVLPRDEMGVAGEGLEGSCVNIQHSLQKAGWGEHQGNKWGENWMGD